MKFLKNPLLWIAVLIVVVFFQNHRLRQLQKENVRQTYNLYLNAINQFEKRLDKLGNEYAITRASIFTKSEFETISADLQQKFDELEIKTRNIMMAGIASLQGVYEFSPDTFYLSNTDSIFVLPQNFVESYRDPSGWFWYNRQNNIIQFKTIDSVIYGTIKEKPLKSNGKKYPIPVRWFKAKEQKELFQSLNPYNQIVFLKVNKLK